MNNPDVIKGYYDMGYADYLRGIKHHANPFIAKPKPAFSWFFGWCCAHEDTF